MTTVHAVWRGLIVYLYLSISVFSGPQVRDVEQTVPRFCMLLLYINKVWPRRDWRGH